VAQSKTLILTNCTGRKRATPEAGLTARSLGVGSHSGVAREWVGRLRLVGNGVRAAELYCGRSVTETFSAARSIRADVAFISAGHGLVEQNERVPAYSLTASQGHLDSVGSRITEPYEPASWWHALARAQGKDRPLAHYIENRGASLVLVAMPASYLAMVIPDLVVLTPKILKTIRVVGPRHQEELPRCLQSSWLPYDARLDSAETGFNGTASDFPHRALRHFAEHILLTRRHAGSERHAEEVTRELARYRPYVRSSGQRVSDNEVISEIVTLWKKHGGRRAAILRELRSVRHIACEQSRFRGLANRVAAELDASP
jgi:hypothetical protein